ncbi:hypothetical protein OB955_08850 [Halobacteria archaeon AArc-m2/3/4]|uniref:Uncharacterized protein n=1 Tax=Natronoglomus mannanivorans TaxID=2979990 RepID=A0ABT2QD41_9EURY|nr:hypothetical protein [Halobacteria archaeon AArc-m2/3/4]
MTDPEPETGATDPRTAWDTPERCPFCETSLANGGSAFIRHVEDRETCRVAFESWRGRVASDIGGEWIG